MTDERDGMTDEAEAEGKGGRILSALKDALGIYRGMPPFELNIITGIDPWEILKIKESIKAAIYELEQIEAWVIRKRIRQAEANRKAVKEGTIRQTLGNPLPPDPSTDEEIALELARQWNDEDVACPPHRRKEDEPE